MPRHRLQQSRALITGASSGIGRAVALEFAKHGTSLVLLARREDRLRALAAELQPTGSLVEVVVGDVTDPAVRHAAVDRCQSRFGGLDVLVNNAGVGAMGRFVDAGPERLRRVMEVNFFALVEMTRLALPLLRDGRGPMIVNVSSILGRRAVPYSCEYSASKFAVHGFSESLRTELAPLKIGVMVVSPGTTETEFFDSVLEKTASPKWPEHRPVTAESVAQAIVRGMRAGRHEIVPYTWGRLLLALNRLSPSLCDRLMERYV
ncbi:MAG: SDR family oxidoreductase [Planctomycetota bacterium]